MARSLLGIYLEEQTLTRGDIVYAGATKGQVDGRGPTTAWQRLGFQQVEIQVKEGAYEQNAMVLRVP